MTSVFPAHTGFLESAERSGGIERCAVDVDLAGAQATGDGQRLLRRARPDRACEPVVGAICDVDRLIKGVESHKDENRAEHLFPRDRHPSRHAGQHGRRNEEAGFGQLSRRFGDVSGAFR
jgi:hypothetical protein